MDLHAAGYLPEIWTPDAVTERKRRLVARRYQVVRHRTQIKNEGNPFAKPPAVLGRLKAVERILE